MINSSKTFFFSALIALLSCTYAVHAQMSAGAPQRANPFAAFDRDGNGMISEQEFNEFRAQRRKARAEQGRMMRGVADAPSFSQIDSNQDGLLSREELMTARQAHMQKRRAMGRQMGPGMDRGMGRPGRGYGPGMGWDRQNPMPGRPSMGRNRPAFSDFDLNGDGRLTENEFTEARNRRMSERARQGYPMRNAANAPSFADIDANADGFVTAEELYDFRAQRMRQRWQR